MTPADFTCPTCKASEGSQCVQPDPVLDRLQVDALMLAPLDYYHAARVDLALRKLLGHVDARCFSLHCEIEKQPDRSYDLRGSRVTIRRAGSAEIVEAAPADLAELRAALAEALDGWDAATIAPEPLNSGGLPSQSFALVLDSAAPYRVKARIAELRKLVTP
jgi:hypothetical protein